MAGYCTAAGSQTGNPGLVRNHVDCAIVAADNALDHRQSHAAPGKFGAEERIEDLDCTSSVMPRPVSLTSNLT
jgi:hypothetical protein